MKGNNNELNVYRKSINPLAPLTTLQACFHEKHFYETQLYG